MSKKKDQPAESIEQLDQLVNELVGKDPRDCSKKTLKFRHELLKSHINKCVERRMSADGPLLTRAKKLKLSIKEEYRRRELDEARMNDPVSEAGGKPPQLDDAAAPCCSEGVGGKAGAVPRLGGGGLSFERQGIAAAAAR